MSSGLFSGLLLTHYLFHSNLVQLWGWLPLLVFLHPSPQSSWDKSPLDSIQSSAACWFTSISGWIPHASLYPPEFSLSLLYVHILFRLGSPTISFFYWQVMLIRRRDPLYMGTRIPKYKCLAFYYFYDTGCLSCVCTTWVPRVLCPCVYTTWMSGARGTQKRASDSPGLELWVISK